MNKLTKFQIQLLIEIFLEAKIVLIKDYKRNKFIGYTHKIIYDSGREKVIRNDTSKAIRRYVKSKFSI